MSAVSPLNLVPHEEQEIAQRPGWQMKELKPWHKNLCSMLAQGIPRATIAAIMDCTPEYVSMLARQPLIQGYVKDMCAYAGLQLEAQFVQSVEAVGEVLANGNAKEKIQAARLQMEATGRIGSRTPANSDSNDMNGKLTDLAGRLVGLLEKQKMANDSKIIEGEANEIEDADISTREVDAVCSGEQGLQPAQGDGNGMPNSGG